MYAIRGIEDSCGKYRTTGANSSTDKTSFIHLSLIHIYVLSQLSVTTLIAYLIINKSYSYQLVVSIALLVLSFLAYTFIKNAEFNESYVIGKNLGSMTDMMLMGKINRGGWVAINCITTAAHTIWGALLGKWIVEEKTKEQKLKWILYAALVMLIVGYVLDFVIGIDVYKRQPLRDRPA